MWSDISASVFFRGYLDSAWVIVIYPRNFGGFDLYATPWRLQKDVCSTDAYVVLNDESLSEGIMICTVVKALFSFEKYVSKVLKSNSKSQEKT